MKTYPHPPRTSVDYGKLMTDSMRLIWRHKFLWFFGLFAWGGTSLGGWNCNVSTGSNNNNGAPASNVNKDVSNWISNHVGLIVALALAAVTIGIVLWLWSVLCRGAVVGSVREARDGEAISFGGAFRRGRRSFGLLVLFDLFLLLLFICLGIIFLAAVLFIVFLIAVAGMTGVGIISLLGLWLGTFFGFGMGYLAICTIWFLPWVFVGILVNFAVRAVVLEGERPMAAFRRAWHIVMKNLTQMLFMFLVSVGLSIGASIAMVIAVGVSSIPAIIAIAVTASRGWPAAGIAVTAVLAIPPFIVLLLVTAVMNTYFTTYWTIGYDQLSGHETPESDSGVHAGGGTAAIPAAPGS